MCLGKRGGLFVLVLLGAGFTPARADSLLGSDLGWQYYAGGGALSPSVGDVPVPGSVTGGSFVDSGGVGAEFIEPTLGGPLPVFNIDSDDTTITFDFSVSTPSTWSNSPLSLSPTIYNGIAINLLSAGSFASVSIDPATNMTGFDAAEVGFTGDQIQINWENLPFNDSTVVTLDVSLGESVGSGTPEPGTYSLMLLSILGAGLACRRKLNLR